MLSVPTTNLSINTDIETIQEQEEFTEVILECENILYEYFKMKPLKNMKVFDTEKKLKEFRRNYEIKPQDNKFYIVSTDRKEMIISTVLHTLPHARIINNNELNDEIISRFKKYASRIEFKICNDETPPPNPSDPSSKKKDIKSNKSIQTDTELFKKEKEKVKNMKDNLSL